MRTKIKPRWPEHSPMACHTNTGNVFWHNTRPTPTPSMASQRSQTPGKIDSFDEPKAGVELKKQGEYTSIVSISKINLYLDKVPIAKMMTTVL